MAHGTLKWLGFWALERFLPKQNVLEIQLRNIVKGAMLMVMGGLILTAVFIGGLIGLHAGLVSQGLHPGFSVAIIGFIALMAAYICFVQADKIFKDIFPQKDTNQLIPKLPDIKVDVALQEGLTVAVGAFLSGLRGKPTPPAVTPDHTVAEVSVTPADEDEAILHFPREKGAKKR